MIQVTSRTLLLACVGASSVRVFAAEPAASRDEDRLIEEIVVTAQKRLERLQDVPVPVSVVDAGTLMESNQVRLQDYYTRLPGLSLTTDTYGQPSLAIRGLTTGTGNPTVGITVDDLPYGSITGLGRVAPDLDPSDLAQVEVLRGPQGTLYGASSIGGLLKFVTADPTTDAMSGRVQAGVSTVHEGDTGYNFRGSINLPLSETWALRASAFTRRDPGYIDDPTYGETDVNEVDVAGGRVVALWQPSESVSVKLGAYLQNIDAQGSASVHDLPGLGDLEQSMLIDTGGYERKMQIYSANVRAQIGDAELTYIGGYGINDLEDAFDYTPAFGPVSEAVFGVAGTPLLETMETKRLTQELRVEMPLGARVDALLGLFYSDEQTGTTQDILAVDPVDGTVAGQWLYDFDKTNFREYAAFADLTFHLTDRWDLQVGGRQSEMKRDYTLVFEGPYVPTFLGEESPLIYPIVETSEDSFTYLLTPQFKISPEHMVYGRFASGYRPGGPNYNVTTFGVPPAYDADQTRNYDLGAKGTLLSRTLTYDVALFYIDWTDIQLLLVDSQSGAGYFTNAGGARSRGAEVAFDWRATPELTLAAWFAWTDAELSEAFPAGSTAFGRPGDRLPFSAEFSGRLSIGYEWTVFGDAAASAGASLSYVDDRTADFTGAAERQHLPSYSQVDANLQLTLGAYDIGLFATNLTDERGMLGGGIGSFPPYAFNYTQPRTIGLNLTRSF